MCTYCYATNKQLRIKNTQGYEDTIVWSPYGDDNMGYKNFVCVESGKVSTPYKLEAGSEAVFKMDLVPGPL
jgi:glucose-6-phosphate 1-epimerase